MAHQIVRHLSINIILNIESNDSIMYNGFRYPYANANYVNVHFITQTNT